MIRARPGSAPPHATPLVALIDNLGENGGGGTARFLGLSGSLPGMLTLGTFIELCPEQCTFLHTTYMLFIRIPSRKKDLQLWELVKRALKSTVFI